MFKNDEGTGLINNRERVRGINREGDGGFTLIELLVVIAIIGILSSVVLASLNNARQDARVASAQSSLKSVQAGAQICMNDSLALDTTPTANEAICAGSDTLWPTLPNGWAYGSSTSSVSAGTFQYDATGDGTTVFCSQSQCAEQG